MFYAAQSIYWLTRGFFSSVDAIYFPGNFEVSGEMRDLAVAGVLTEPLNFVWTNVAWRDAGHSTDCKDLSEQRVEAFFDAIAKLYFVSHNHFAK